MAKDFSFFGKADRNKFTNAVQSEYPGWMHSTHVEELEEGINHKRRMLEQDMVEMANKPYIKEELRNEEKRLDFILRDKPEIPENMKDKIAETYREIGIKIADTLFSRSEMAKGIASAHEEARRMVEACIVIENPQIIRACNVTPTVDNRVTRNEASKVYKILGKYLGESTNVEYLRRD